MMNNMKLSALALATAGLLASGAASASLSTFQTFVGNVGYSSDGFGSLSQSGTISASVPAGSTVLAAYLYSSLYGNSSATGVGATLGGNAVSFGSAVAQVPSCCGLSSVRADVTSIVKPVIDGGVGGVYNFSITEASDTQDGEALVVVYSNAALPTATFAILDGFSISSGDSTSINFASPLDPNAAGFFAEMFLGIGFSCCGQDSSVTVNGTTITDVAGNNDDGDAVANGSLITVGGYDDPFSALLPTYDADHERYNLVPYIDNGDTSIVIDTVNPSGDDNIFLAGFYVSGEASVEPVPEPGMLALFGLGALGLAFARRRTA